MLEECLSFFLSFFLSLFSLCNSRFFFLSSFYMLLLFSWNLVAVQVMGMRGTMMRFGLVLLCVVDGRCMMVSICWLTALPTVCPVLLDVLTCFVLFCLASFGWRLLCSFWPYFFGDDLVWLGIVTVATLVIIQTSLVRV